MADTQVRVREVVGSLNIVDAHSLLSPAVLERIVTAVMQAMQAHRADEASRRRDTRIGGGCGCDGGEAS